MAAALLAAPATAQAFEDAAPLPPAGAAPSFVPPPHDATGYRTPNSGLTPDAAVWHVRVALNVAALGCRGPGEAATVAAYNAVLRTNVATLAAASAGTEKQFKARNGAAWQSRYDNDMTRLYHFFAQPPAQSGFCATAEAVLRESAGVEPSDFAAFAASALPRLEAPFLTFFAAYDEYRASLAEWKGRHTAVVIATASATPAAPAAFVAAPATANPAATPEQAAPVEIVSLSARAIGPQP